MATLALSVTAVIKLRESMAYIIAQYNEAPAIFGQGDVARCALSRRQGFRSAGRESSRPTPSHQCWNYRESNVANRVGPCKEFLESASLHVGGARAIHADSLLSPSLLRE